MTKSELDRMKELCENKGRGMSDQLATELCERTIVWQDHSHGNGYNPKLTMLKFPNGKLALELQVFGTVSVLPYVKPECEHV
jgi:hypothetical protein